MEHSRPRASILIAPLTAQDCDGQDNDRDRKADPRPPERFGHACEGTRLAIRLWPGSGDIAGRRAKRSVLTPYDHGSLAGGREPPGGSISGAGSEQQNRAVLKRLVLAMALAMVAGCATPPPTPRPAVAPTPTETAAPSPAPTPTQAATVSCDPEPDEWARTDDEPRPLPVGALTCEAGVALAARKIDPRLPIESITFVYGLWCAPRTYCAISVAGQAYILFSVVGSSMAYLVQITTDEHGNLVAHDPEGLPAEQTRCALARRRPSTHPRHLYC